MLPRAQPLQQTTLSPPHLAAGQLGAYTAVQQTMENENKQPLP
jgi:hypothetical protein